MARWLFLILLLCNLLLFTWGYRQPDPLAGTRRSTTKALPGTELLLKDERPLLVSAGGAKRATATRKLEPEHARHADKGDGKRPPEPMAETEPGEVAPKGCLRLGPIEQLMNGKALLKILQDDGLEAILYIQESVQEDGFWLLIANLDGDRQLTLQALQQAGLQDIWSFANGELSGFVSVGYFATRQAAELHQREVIEKGFSPRIHPRRRQVDRYWIDVRFPSNTAIKDDLLKMIHTQHAELGFSSKPCSEIVSTAIIE